jgi:hypothetical protein
LPGIDFSLFLNYNRIITFYQKKGFFMSKLKLLLLLFLFGGIACCQAKNKIGYISHELCPNNDYEKSLHLNKSFEKKSGFVYLFSDSSARLMFTLNKGVVSFDKGKVVLLGSFSQVPRVAILCKKNLSEKKLKKLQEIIRNTPGLLAHDNSNPVYEYSLFMKRAKKIKSLGKTLDNLEQKSDPKLDPTPTTSVSEPPSEPASSTLDDQDGCGPPPISEKE